MAPFYLRTVMRTVDIREIKLDKESIKKAISDYLRSESVIGYSTNLGDIDVKYEVTPTNIVSGALVRITLEVNDD